jgi:hypothetical protein
MRLRDNDSLIVSAAVGGPWLLLGSAHSAQTRIGHPVSSGSSITAMIPHCRPWRSARHPARGLTATLAGLGFHVIAHEDATGGGRAAAIDEMAAERGAPGASAVLSPAPRRHDVLARR